MAKIRHVDFYADEWLVGTKRLNPSEIAVYITACALIYSHGGPIVKEDIRDFLKCRGKVLDGALNRLIALGKLTLNGQQIDSKRCAKELQRCNERVAKAQQNGSKGGRPPNEINDLEKPPGLFQSNLTTNYQLPTKKEDSPPPPKRGRDDGQGEGADDEGKRGKTKRARAKPEHVDSEFGPFWEACPLKLGKQGALRKYQIARRQTDAATLLAGMQRYAESVAGKERQYVAHPATWLHNGRWADEYPQSDPPQRDEPPRPLTPEEREAIINSIRTGKKVSINEHAIH